MTRKFLLIFLSLLLTLSLAVGCSAAGDDLKEMEAPEANQGASVDGSASSGGNLATTEKPSEQTDRKLIRTMNMTVNTLKFEEFTEKVRKSVTDCGGYIEQATESAPSKGSRTATMTLRIPAGEADGIAELIGSLGEVVRSSEQMSDVTLSYVDTQSRLKALRAEETSLLELLESAKSVSEIISLQDRLSNVRYQIESAESTLRSYDNRVDYTTLSLTVTEVEEIVEEKELTVWEEIGQNLSAAMKDLGIFFRELFVLFVSSLPYLTVFVFLPGVIVFLAIYLPIRRHRKKAARQRASEEA